MITLEQLQAGIVLPVDKPRQWTSFQTVNKVKSTVRNTYGLKKFKIGHAGTLDPLATGLLLVCIGKATKSIPQLQDGEKVYTGTMVLGATTPCFDLEQAVDQYYPYLHITPALLDQVRRQFVGTIMQAPPIFSAVKVEGQRAYHLARQGDTPETSQPQAKAVTINSFEITAFRPGSQREDSGQGLVASDQLATATVKQTTDHCPLSTNSHLYDNPQGHIPPHLPQIDFRISCGKGTYIRSLARDFGVALGSGAFLSALRRQQVGHYTVDHALTPDQIEPYLTINN